MREKIKFILSVNWIKTIYFNFKMFPFSISKKLPVYFYGYVSFKKLTGKIVIDAPIKSGMIGFGQRYELFSKSTKTAQLGIEGTIIFKGNVQFGIDYSVFVADKALLEMGNMSSLGSRGKIICFDKVVLGDFTRIGFESQLIDTTAHSMINTLTKEKYPITNPIVLGSYNYISNRVTILGKAKTADYCTIASNSVCNKNYTSLGENILIGGIPAKLIKNNISRDWVGEKKDLMKWLMI